MNQILNRHLEEIAKGYNFDKLITMHTSRHSFGSTMIEGNVNLSTMMQLMGHQPIKQTEVYARALQSSLYDSVDKLDNLFGHAV